MRHLLKLERRALCELLETLSDEQWSLPSLCDGWTIHDVAGHLAGWRHRTGWNPVKLARFTVEMMQMGSLSGVNQYHVEAWRKRDRHEVIAELRRQLHRGIAHSDQSLTEFFLHAQDIRRPLGVSRRHSNRRLRRVLDNMESFPLTGADQRMEGLHLRATDIAWERGAGPEVSGPAEALIMAVHGRRTALDDLSGDGLDTLAAREVQLPPGVAGPARGATGTTG